MLASILTMDEWSGYYKVYWVQLQTIFDSKFNNFATRVQYLKFQFIWNKCILSMSVVIERHAWYLIHNSQN